MKLVLIGGTGFLGRAIIEAALKRNIRLVAIARDTSKLTKFNNSIEVVKADYFELSPIANQFEAADAVISTIGPPENRTSVLTPNDFGKAMTNLVTFIDKTSNKRFVHIASAGTSYKGETISILRKLMRYLISLVAPVVIPAKEQELKVLMNSSINWTSIRPPLINNAGKGVLSANNSKQQGFTVDVNQLAEFILDCIEKNLWLKQAPFVASK